MPIYKIQAPDGNVYRIQGPAGANPEDLFQAVAEQHPMAAKTTEELQAAPNAPTSISDIARSLGMGLTGGVKSLTDVFGAGSDISNYLGGVQNQLQAGLTPERQAEMAREQELSSRAEKQGIGSEIIQGLKNVAHAPIQSIAQAAGSSLPMIVGGLATLPESAPAALALGVQRGVSLLIAAAQGVGEVKGDIHDKIKQTYIDKGVPEAEAAKLAVQAQEYTIKNAPLLIGGAAFGALDAATGFEKSASKALKGAFKGEEKALEGEALNKAVASLGKPMEKPTPLRSFLSTAGGEGATEALQGGFGQAAQNIAMSNEGFETPTMQGVAGAAAHDALIGALTGGVFSPLHHRGQMQDYAADRFLRETKAAQDEEAAKDEAFKRYQEQQEKVKQGLGVPDQKMLALPAPAKAAEIEQDPLLNPVGRVTEDELGKAIGDNTVVNYLNKYRKDNNLPKLKSYSIEDIKDAMTAQNPEGEEGALNAILAYKTKYNNESYTPEDIQNRAVAKNVATETKGWNDFLTRATGKSDLTTMTQPELHSVATALDALPRTGREEQLVLPEGSNATRFTQDQYNQGVTSALMGVKEGKPITLDQARNAVKTQTDLKNDRDADHVLKTAAANDDLVIERGMGYQAISPNGTVLGTYGTESDAKRNHRRAEINPVETQLVKAPQEVNAEKVAELPQGYEIQKKTVAGETTPAAYVVREDGSQTNASQTFADENDAKDRLNVLTRKREANALAEEAAADRVRKDLEAKQSKIAQMEADGLTGTAEHRNAVNAFQAANVTGSAKITEHLEKAEALRKPLKVVPLGKKTVRVEKHTVIKNGKEIGTFTSDKGKTGRTKAEEHILSQATEEELQKIADRGGVFGKRAETELKDRKRTETGIKVKGTKEGLEAAGVHTQQVEAQLQELKAKLLPMLKKFGLEDVGLNIVRAIENDADGAWGKADKLIRIALQAAEPIKTMRHEALHALKELGFFTPQQWEALKRQAEKTWVDKYLKGQMVEVNGKEMTRYDAYANGVKDENGEWILKPLSPEDILEEAIADAFGSWEGGEKPPPGLMAALFKRMQQFFSALRNALTGAGFESADDIFGKVERGELKAGKEAGGAETKASLKNTTKGFLNPNISPKQEKIINDVIDEMGLTPQEFASTSLIHQTGKAGVEQFESDKIGGLPEVVQFLQDERRKSGLPLLDVDKPEDRKIIAKLMATEAMAAIRSGGANLEWYDSIINKTLAMAGLKYPELNTDINARMAFKIATAITSQGLNVEDNLAFAMKVYDQFRQGGRFPEIGQGADQSAMVNNFKLANYLMDDMGANLLRQFLETEFTVEEMRSAGFDIKGELGDEKVLGSSVFGPKIGFGFYSNLNGNFDPVTMDMWFMRTIGRLTGKLKSFRQDLYDTQLQKFRDELDTEGSNGVFANQFNQDEIEKAKIDDKAAEALARKVKSAHERDFKANREAYDEGKREKSKLVAASETMIKSLDAPKDAPANGSERRNLRDIVRQMVDIVEEKYGKRVPPASLQAVIWYPEQELYKAMGVKLRVTSQNYAGAIEKILKGEGYGESNLSAAAKLGSRTAQQLAKSAVAKGTKEAGAESVRLGALKAEEKEALLERGRKRVVLEEEKETPKRKRVIFEVAPDPNNKALTDKWRALPNEVRIKISDKIGNTIIKNALEKLGLTGYVDTQVGSYLDDTNPSFALYLDSGDSVAVAKFLGYALSQDAMMVVSPKEGKGLDQTGAVRINIGDVPASKVDKIYQQLREIEVDGEKPVGGQSYMNGHMVVLNYSGVPTDQLAKLINDKLDDKYEVITEDVYTAFPEKKDYDYANPSSDPRGNAGVLRQASRDLRAEATRLLQKELKQFKPEAPAEEGKLSLRTYFPTAEEAEKAAYKKAPPETAEFKRFFGGSKIMEEGRAVPMFHASPNVFDVFRENKPIFVSPSAEEAEYFGKRHRTPEKMDVNIYPLWVRAETPFDFENPNHIRQLGSVLAMDQDMLDSIKEGHWETIESQDVQDALQDAGFDSFFVKEYKSKNLAVFNANQVKSITGNIGEFGENKDIRYSLRKFDSADLPTDKKPFTLPENTMIFHGAHKDAAQKIKDAGRVLLSYPGVKSSSGNLDEGGLIFFGDEETASNFANQKADFMSVQAARERGEARLPGTVFETVTDRPYRLMNRYHKLTKQQATALNKALGIPDYKQLSAGDDASLAATRAHTNSDVIKREKIPNKGEMSSPWPVIFKTLGFDGFYDNRNAPAVVLTADNGIRLIGDDGRLVKYSLPTYSKDAADAVERTTTRREEKGFIGRILDAIYPENFSDLRAQLIDRYARLSYYDKKVAERMGGANLLADVSASAAANFSDLAASVTASAFGVGNRQGGIPVYKNGHTTIDTSVKGGLEILKPLAQFNDPKAYQDYQFWAGVKRGTRLDAEGKEKNFDKRDQVWAKEIYDAYKAKGVDFSTIQSEMNEFNKGVVKYMVDTGVISPEMGVHYMKWNDYIPFYRQIEGERTAGPKIFNAISGVKPPKKIKGGEAPLGDFFENFVRNTQSAINSGMKNVAAQRAVDAALKIGDISGAERLNTIDNAPDCVQVLEKGKQVSYRVADQLFINAVKSLNMAEMPLLGIFSAPSNLLRNLVTKDPGFMLANLMRDSLSAWVTSGANITPIAGTVNHFVQALSGKSKGMQALLNAGILGGYEFSSGTLKSGEALEKDLQKKYGSKGKFSPLKTFSTVWDALEHGTEASDAATRIAIYERVLAETGNEAEALHRSLEVMNFNRKGSSPLVRILTAAIPFLNARVQGLDVFYRTAFGVDVDANAKAKQKAFFVRGATLMALSAAYFMLVSDDDEWKKQEQETKDNYWILPGIGKFPTPFEVGFLFKTMPERIMALAFKDDTSKDFKDSMIRGFANTLAFNPIPQVAKPIIEYNANYNFFTGRPIVGQGMQGVAPEFQAGPNTSEVAQVMGKALGMSPLKLDQLISSYTGTMGMYGVQLIDSILSAEDNSPHASKRFEQLPIIKRFAADPEARGNITQYYELKNAVDTAVQTENFLLKSGNAEEYAKYMEENAGLLASKGYVNSIEKDMKKYREMRKLIANAEMTADEKRDALTMLGQAENNATKDIQMVKKMISEYQ